MRVSCPSCQTNYNIDDKRIPPGGAKLKCSKCQTLFPIKAPAAAASDDSAVPLPGAPGSSGAIPLPGSGPSASSGAIPLPGSAAPAPVATPAAPTWADAAIPLPGAGKVPPPPPPTANDPFASFGDFGGAGGAADEDSTRVVKMAVPTAAFREGAAPPPSNAVPLPASKAIAPPPPPAADFSSFDAPSAGAVPLPGYAPAPAMDFSFDGGGDDAVPLPGSDPFSFVESPVGAVPLPGSVPAQQELPPEVDFGFDVPSHDAVPLPGSESFGLNLDAQRAAPASPPPSFDFDFSSPPPQAQAEDDEVPFDDSAVALPGPAPTELPSRAPSAIIAPPPPPDLSFDFEDLPSPAGAPAAYAPPPAEVDFGSPPPPPAEFAVDFGDLPSPAAAAPQSVNFDFANLPSPAAPATPPPAPAVDFSASFGEVDFGDPAPAQAPSFDDLGPDLAAPPQPARSTRPADGLEMLSFVDDTAQDAGAQKLAPQRFHVRRRSGKVFGPFEQSVIVKMLEDGQLLGNEDVSADGHAWSAIGTVGAFDHALHKLTQAPAGATEPARPTTAQTMERLRSVYEGRMATVTVVDRRAESDRLKRRLPLFIAAGVILLVVGAGASLAFTRYGAFGLKVLLPAKVSPGSPQYTQLKKAKDALLADTFKSYTDARNATDAILKAKEYPEVRAVWCQAVFYLDRRYAAATPAQLARARQELPNIELLGEKHPEVVKARAGEALASGRPDDARLMLEDAVIRTDSDAELKLLLAEAYVARNQPERAMQTLEKVLARRPDSARALHLLGQLHRASAERLNNAGKRDDAGKEATRAAELFASALRADPEHVISAVELAGIQVLVHKDPDQGMDALAKALDEKSKSLMGPAELARARALNGAALAMKFQVADAVKEFEEALKLDKQSIFAKAQLGRIYLQQREFEKAVPLLAEASKKESNNLDYVEGYLTALIGAGKMNDALTVLQGANAQFPDTPRIAYLDARVNDALDNTRKAEDNYLRALKGDDSLYEANLHLAQLYLRSHRTDEARAQSDAALKKAPEVAQVNAGMGDVLLAEDKPAEAQAAFEKAASLDPTLPDARLGLSRVAFRDGRLDDALEQVEKALALDATLKGGHLQKGLVLWKQRKLDEAVAALEEAKKNEPSNARVSVTLGAVKLDRADLAGAETALLTALTVEPRNPEANFYLARVKSLRAEHTQAIERMRLALDSAPNNPTYHYWMGLVFRQAKKPAEAMAQWTEAVKLDPKYADAMEQLGQALLDRGEFEEAIGQFQAALAVDPTRGNLHGLIGDAWFQATQWDRAIRGYKDALKADPGLTYVYYKIGRALSEQGKPGQAIEWYRRATAVDPQNAMPFYFLGYLYKERSQAREAIQAFRSYLERRQDAPDKREIEDEIYDLQQGM